MGHVGPLPHRLAEGRGTPRRSPPAAAPVGRAWLEAARRYFEEAPGRVTIVRDQDGAIAGYGVAVTPANAPSFAADDPVLGPRLRHAAERVPGGAAVVLRQAVDLTRDRPSPVVGLIGMAAVTGSGLANPDRDLPADLPLPTRPRWRSAPPAERGRSRS